MRWLVALALVVGTAHADAGQCHVIDVDFIPAKNLQIVVWVEDTAGHFIDTIFVTQSIGTYGLGNRPGRFDFNSGSPLFPSWPYGRRTTTFPVWAHRHGLSWPEIDFQNGSDSDLSHPFNQSSTEFHYCQPLPMDSPVWDVTTCATVVGTDKGVLSQSKTSLYPPRSDLTRNVMYDSASVDMYGTLNPFDAVSQPTPAGGVAAQVTWPIPPTLPLGNYVMFAEVSREFDMNGTYNENTFPAPVGIPYADYGAPYRGQPSIIYRVPFTVGDTNTTADITDYTGYGDPDGLDGNIRPPDNTITTDTPGSGASRLQLVSDSGVYRLRVVTRNENDSVPPGAPTSPAITHVEAKSATIQFTAPGDDGVIGRVRGYEIRYRAGEMTDANFETAGSTAVAGVAPVDPGRPQTVTVAGLLPETDYQVGIRAFDECHNAGPLLVVPITTSDRQAGEVDACFVATAAYGSPLAGDVGMLRKFRDAMLRSSVLGELAVEAYYTFGPLAAGVVGESDVLRATARAALDPLVTRVRTLAY
jgi:Fibronectin type III domain